MYTRMRALAWFGYLLFLPILGCGADTAAVAVLAAAAGGSTAAAQGSNDGTTTGETPTDNLSNLNGIYHISATSSNTSLVSCPASFTGWFEADGATREITRGFFFFMDCNTLTLDRVEVDGDFLFEDIDNDVCGQARCLRFELVVSGQLGQTFRVWRGFMINEGDGIVFAQVDPEFGSVLAGSGWRTSGGTASTTDTMTETPADTTNTGM